MTKEICENCGKIKEEHYSGFSEKTDRIYCNRTGRGKKFKAKEEFNLSELEQIHRSYTDEERSHCFLKKDIKEFIKRDTELINQFACGNITLLELKQERKELAGEKLVK